MALFKQGSLIVGANTTAQSLVLGFVPEYFMMLNETKIAGSTNGIVKAEWFSTMANGYAILQTTTTNVPAYSEITSNGITPLVTTDPNIWIPPQAPYNATSGGNRAYIQQSTNLIITNISNAAQAVVTATHSFTASDNNVTWVTFSQVVGMNQINTLRGQVVSSTSTTSFTVNINTTNFSGYTSGGIANVITGAPVTTQFGPQIQQTPLYNQAVAGLTLGSGVMITANDVWKWIAFYDTSVTG